MIIEWLGEARLGMDRHGMAKQGKARQPLTFKNERSWAWLDEAKRGVAWLGMARLGKARQGKGIITKSRSNPMTKKCSKCRQVKPTDQFRKDKRQGFQRYCKVCEKIYFREYMREYQRIQRGYYDRH